MERKRYHTLDTLRGIALLNMIAYHAVWDLVNIFHLDWKWYHSEGAHIWQQFICCTFILLSGFCQPLGRKNLKRGIIVFLAGAAVSVATIIFMPESKIMFGVLTLIGSCMILSSFAGSILRKCNPTISIIINLILFITFRHISKGYIGFGGSILFELPHKLYRNLITAYFGFPAHDFYSTDYFPLFPWIFLFAAGYFLFFIAEKNKLLKYLEPSRFQPIEWLGKHSLEVYIIHQPAIYLILYSANKLLTQ